MEAQVVTIDQPFHSAYEKCIEITDHLRSAMAGDKTHRAIEASLETDGRALLRLLWQDHVDHQGSGRVSDAGCGSDGVVRSPTREDMETGSTSVCGAVRVARTGESQRGVANVFPRDAPLHLPARGDSHRLQKRVAAKAAKMSFDEVAKDSATETAVRLGTRQGEPIVDDAAHDVDALDAQPCSPALQPDAQAKPMQVLTFDGQGVVMRTEAVREATRKKVEARAPHAPRGFARQAKSNRKRLATVAGLSPLDRHIRAPHTVARHFAPLRLVPSNPPRAPKPVGKKRWACRQKPMKTVMETPCAAGLRRDPAQQAEGVVLVDGDATPIDEVKKAAQAHGVSVVMI
jgi:hypothetical protein